MGKLLARLGSTKRKQQFLKWEKGNESLWTFEVSQADVNKQILKQKRYLEKQLSDGAAKRKKIEVEVKALRSTTTQIIARLKTGRSESSRGKLWHQYSRQQQHNRRKMLASGVTNVLGFCTDEGFGHAH